MASALVAVLLISYVTLGYCYLPKFKDCTAYTIIKPEDYGQDLDSDHPYGFYEASIPHPQDDPDRKNPCVQLSGLTDTNVEILAEPLQAGAPVCVQDHTGSSPAECAAGRLRVCLEPGADELKFEFFCRDSCQSSDQDFQFRFVVSPKDPSDNWCNDRAPNYPSDLAPEPPEIPDVVTKKPTPENAAVSVSSSFSLLVSLLAVVISVMFR